MNVRTRVHGLARPTRTRTAAGVILLSALAWASYAHAKCEREVESVQLEVVAVTADGSPASDETLQAWEGTVADLTARGDGVRLRVRPRDEPPFESIFLAGGE